MRDFSMINHRNNFDLMIFASMPILTKSTPAIKNHFCKSSTSVTCNAPNMNGINTKYMNNAIAPMTITLSGNLTLLIKTSQDKDVLWIPKIQYGNHSKALFFGVWL